MALVPSVEAVSWCRKPADLVPGAGGGDGAGGCWAWALLSWEHLGSSLGCLG